MIAVENQMSSQQPAPIQEKKWLMEIKPQSKWFELHLDDLWRYRDLVSMFIYREFSAYYKQTILGPLWFLIQPILTTITFMIVFTNVAKISTGGVPPALFYLSGLILWTYFSTCFTKVSETFTSNAHIFGKVYFPRLAVPVATVMCTAISFGIQFLLFIAIWIYYYLIGTDISLSVQTLLIPYLIILMAALGLGGGIIISSLTIKYRDLKFLITFGIQLLMYATPVIYPMSALPEKYRTIILINPISGIIETFRFALLGSGSFDPFMLLYSSIATFIILFIGLLIFNRVEKNFMDIV